MKSIGLRQRNANIMPGLSSGSAKRIAEITRDRITIDHYPTRFVKVYVDPRQDGVAMNKEAIWIADRILFLEEFYKRNHGTMFEL